MQHAPLPLPWIESLFGRLITTWGQPFLQQYQGIDIEVVKHDWAEKLGGFQLPGGPDGKPWAPAINYALDNLPERPLNAIGFRQLCRGYTHTPRQPMLPGSEPEPMPERLKAAFERLKEPVSDEPPRVRWARRYISLWGGHRTLIARRAALLKEAQGIVRSYEAQLERADQAREGAPA